MMDPVSALGLASAVVALAEFSWKVAAGAVEIFRSADGMIDENKEVKRAKETLREVSESLKKGVSDGTKAEQEIKRLAEKCQKDSEEVLALLKLMCAPKDSNDSKLSGAWKGFKASFHSILKKGRLEQLKKQLSACQFEILFHTANLLR
jgi:CRISPR/Cas system-associated endonuclease Cas3-HD